MKSLNKKIERIWLGIGIFFLAIILTICIISCVVAGNEYFLLTFIICLIVFLISVFFAIICPILKYHYYKYDYNEKEIYIHSGFIFRHQIVIPVCQIQDLHIYQGPLMLMCKLGGVVISTAGSNYSINGMSLQEASEMVQKLSINLEKRIEELKDGE